MAAIDFSSYYGSEATPYATDINSPGGGAFNERTMTQASADPWAQYSAGAYPTLSNLKENPDPNVYLHPETLPSAGAMAAMSALSSLSNRKENPDPNVYLHPETLPSAGELAPAGARFTHPPAATTGISGAASSSNPATTYGNDPNASLLINTVLSRLAQLNRPVDTTAQDAYIKQALDRVQQLSGAPFTDNQSQALLTKNMEPLTQARDQAKQQAAEDLSRRGFTPTSGVFQDRMKQIDLAYQRGVSNVVNTLNVKGIDQQTVNANTQLAIMNSIVDMSRATQMQQEGLSSQLVPTAATLSNLDNSRLSLLLQAANSGNPDQLISALTGVGQLGNQTQYLQNQQSAASSAALAQLIYALMNGAGGLL